MAGSNRPRRPRPRRSLHPPARRYCVADPPAGSRSDRAVICLAYGDEGRLDRRFDPTSMSPAVYGSPVRSQRRCSRAACKQPAVATLTYVYADSTAVIGPLATFPEPHIYDLCEVHGRRMTAPRGWELVRHEGDFSHTPSSDDLVALAEAVREAARPAAGGDVPSHRSPSGGVPAEGGAETPSRRGHLRALPSLP